MSGFNTLLFPRIRLLIPQTKLCFEAPLLVTIILTSYCEVYVLATVSDRKLAV